MSQIWKMTKSIIMWLMGESDDESQCKCDWSDEDENQIDESSGIGTVIVIYMILAGFFLGAYLLPTPVTQGMRQQHHQQQQQQRRGQQQQEVTKEKVAKKAKTKSKTLSVPKNEPLDNWHDVLLPQTEDIPWLLYAHQHNLLLLSNDQQQLRQLQQQLIMTLSMQEQFYDLPSSDDSHEDQFKDISESSHVDLRPTTTTITPTTGTTTAAKLQYVL